MAAFIPSFRAFRTLPVSALWRVTLLIVRAAPVESALVLLTNLCVGAIPPALLWLGKLVIDEVARLMTTPPTDPLAAILASPPLLAAIIGFVGAHVLGDALDSIGSFQFSSLRDRLELTIKELVFTKINALDDLTLV